MNGVHGRGGTLYRTNIRKFYVECKLDDKSI